MVIRYRDKNRIVAGTHPYIELFGLLLFASGILALMLCLLMSDEVQREFGFNFAFSLLLVMVGGWLAFLTTKVVIDRNEKTIAISAFLTYSATWRLRDISHIELFRMSPFPGAKSLWSTVLVSKSGNRERFPAGFARNELRLFAAMAYECEIEVTLGNPGEILSTLNKVLEADPDHIHLRWLRAVLYGLKKKFKQSAQELEAVLRLAGTELRLRRSYGQALMILMRFEDALAQFEACNQVEPEDLGTQLTCIELLRVLGRYSEALPRAEELYAKSDDKASMIHLTYADLHQVCGVSEKAIPALERMLKVQSPVADKPEAIYTVDALITRALALSRLKRFDEAESDFARAMKFSHMAPLLIVHYAGYLAYRAQFAGEQRDEFEKKALYQLEVIHKSPAVVPAIFYDSDYRFMQDHPKFKELKDAALAHFEEKQNRDVENDELKFLVKIP